MILNAFFLEMFGDKYFPILSLIFSLIELSLFLDAIGQAAEPLINIYLGEENFDGVAKVMDIAIRTALILGAATIPIIFIFNESIIEIFNIDKAIFAESILAIRIFAFAMPFLSLLYLFATYYQILRHMILALALSFCKDFAFYITLPVIFSLAMGINGIWLGMMLVSMITCALFIIFLRIRHKKAFPLLLPTKDIVSWDAKLNLEKVLELRDRAEAEFLKRGFDGKISMKAALIVEEIGMSIVDNNPNTPPLVEMTLFFDEQPKIIIRDNGMNFDLTDEAVSSFRSFVIYSFLEGSQIDNKYLTTQNYNRHIFSLKNDSGSF